jgi:hypothetical protein
MTRVLITAIALLISVNLAAAATGDRCKVTDPTGTPLNVREAPNGKVAGTVKNGALVTILKTEEQNGKPWAFVADYETKKEIGWVFREFVSCF